MIIVYVIIYIAACFIVTMYTRSHFIGTVQFKCKCDAYNVIECVANINGGVASRPVILLLHTHT